MTVCVIVGVCISNREKAKSKEYESLLLTMSPEEVLRDHIKWRGENNSKMATQTVYHKEGGGFNPIKSIRIISLRETERDSYRPPLDGFYDSREFVVKYEIKYWSNNWSEWVSGLTNGTYEENYTMVKETEESPWLMYEHGF